MRIGKNTALNGVDGIAITIMLTVVMQGGLNLPSGKVGNFSYVKAKKLVTVVGNVVKIDAKIVETVNYNSSIMLKAKAKQKNSLFT